MRSPWIGGVMLGMFLLGLYAARATPGTSGGATKDGLWFAGTLRGTSGAQSLTFTFKKGAAEVCRTEVKGVTPDADGAFGVEVPLSSCPGTLFDGADVTFDVAVGAARLITGQPVSPVPYARYADQVGTPDCPVGYVRDKDAANILLCKKGADEVVRVGKGTAAFWIDRYEASIWEKEDGSGKQYGRLPSGGDWPIATFPYTGQVKKGQELYALSKTGVQPSLHMSWFQAVEACAASGKSLPTRIEWLRAARGTPDPPMDSDGTGGTCRTIAGLRNTGLGTACESDWGAQDMIGNLNEWTDEWYAGLGTTLAGYRPWPQEAGNFGMDLVTNIDSKAYPRAGRMPELGIPSAAMRGGAADGGTAVGIYHLLLNFAPSATENLVGFRCVIRR